jgi:hypothetical protein
MRVKKCNATKGKQEEVKIFILISEIPTHSYHTFGYQSIVREAYTLQLRDCPILL